MIPAGFEYHAPTSIAEATGLLARLGEDAKVLSGGRALSRSSSCASPARATSSTSTASPARLREGSRRRSAHRSLAREVDLDESEVVRSRYPLLADATRVIADPIVRNLATVAGNLAHGDPPTTTPR